MSLAYGQTTRNVNHTKCASFYLLFTSRTVYWARLLMYRDTDPNLSWQKISARLRVSKRQLRSASMSEAVSFTHGITNLLSPSGLG